MSDGTSITEGNVVARLLTPADVAAMLGVTVQTIYQWRSRPTPYGPPAFKVGKYLRWEPEDVAEWIRQQRPESNVTPLRRGA